MLSRPGDDALMDAMNRNMRLRASVTSGDLLSVQSYTHEGGRFLLASINYIDPGDCCIDRCPVLLQIHVLTIVAHDKDGVLNI